MPELTFAVEDAAAVEFAAVPTLLFKLRVECSSGEPIRSVSLNTQLRISANHRPYTGDEQRRLVDVFGPPQQWATSLGSLLWTHVSCVIPPFETGTLIDLLVPCTYDFEIVSAKYFHALDGGSAPLLFLFSGTVFYAGEAGLQVARIAWDKEANYHLPVGVWKQAMDAVFPRSAWLRVPRETFARLADFRARRALPSWADALDALLEAHAREELVSP